MHRDVVAAFGACDGAAVKTATTTPMSQSAPADVGGSERGAAFRPPLPADVQEVVLLFAIAARVVADEPKSLTAVTDALRAAAAGLVPPEVHAANHCLRLWAVFVERLRSRRERASVSIASRRLYDQLEELGQRFDLPPLANWEDLPAALEGLEERRGVQSVGGGGTGPSEQGISVKELSARVRGVWPPKGVLRVRAGVLAPLVQQVAMSERAELVARMVERGVLGRGEAALLARWLVKGTPLGAHDTVLQEVLEKVAGSLAAA